MKIFNALIHRLLLTINCKNWYVVASIAVFFPQPPNPKQKSGENLSPPRYKTHYLLIY